VITHGSTLRSPTGIAPAVGRLVTCVSLRQRGTEAATSLQIR
jgi:hypothetical protein